MSGKKGWHGVDLDGTLARYDGWKGDSHIGQPIPKMVARIREWLRNGEEVRIMTARVGSDDPEEVAFATKLIQQWCLEHIGALLPVTCKKDYGMIDLWDDRAVSVIPNTGTTLQEFYASQDKATAWR